MKPPAITAALSVAQGNAPRLQAFSNQRIRIRRYWDSTSRPVEPRRPRGGPAS